MAFMQIFKDWDCIAQNSWVELLRNNISIRLMILSTGCTVSPKHTGPLNGFFFLYLHLSLMQEAFILYVHIIKVPLLIEHKGTLTAISVKKEPGQLTLN